MAEPESWEEALDIDDSDFAPLRPSKRLNLNPDLASAAIASAAQPFLRHCSQTLPSQNHQNLLPISQPQPQPSVSPRLIPGPAGTVQAAMLRRRMNPTDRIVQGDFGEEIIATQEYIRRAVEDAVEDDDDFTRDPWLSAVEFIRLQGLALTDGAIGVPLRAIKSRCNVDKVSQVVAVVKSRTLNSLGSMMVTLKDPTGTIDATIHGRVLTKGELGKDISVGAVMILREVAVFSPSRFAHYLNITLNNIVKVISKDGVLFEQNCSVKHGFPVNVIAERSEKSWMPEKPISLTPGMTEEIMNSLRHNAGTKGSSHRGEQVESCTATNSYLSDGNKKRQEAASRKDQLLAHQDLDNRLKVVDGTYKEKNNKEIAVHEQLNNSSPSTHSARGSMLEGDNQGSGNANGNKRRQPTNAGALLPQWTDEQLDELFVFD